MFLEFVAKTASSCHQGKSADIRSMNVTFQSGAMGHPISAQKMGLCRMGFPVVTTPTAVSVVVNVPSNPTSLSFIHKRVLDFIKSFFCIY